MMGETRYGCLNWAKGLDYYDKAGADYKVVYKRNVDAGTASVYVKGKGKGNYRGMKKATFTITAFVDPIVANWNNIDARFIEADGVNADYILSGVKIYADGTARRYITGLGGADYRWWKEGDGTYTFITVSSDEEEGFERHQGGVYIDENDKLHWGSMVYDRH